MTSELFPALDNALVRRLLRDGVRVDRSRSVDYAAVLILERLGLIRVRLRQFVRCAYRKDLDFSEIPDPECEGTIEIEDDEHALFCPDCGRPIENMTSKHHFEEVKVALNPDGILEYVGQAMANLSNVTSVSSLGYGTFSLLLADDRRLKLVVLDFAAARDRFAGLYFAEPYLYVVVSELNDPVKHVLEAQGYLQLADILSRDATWLGGQVDVAAYPIPDRVELEPIEQQFEAMLARRDGWQYFEQQFAPALQAHITEHPALVARYLGQLKRFSGTVLNYFTVPIGGAGRTDMRPINKLELMNEVFSGDAIADAKRYVRTTLEQDHISKILLHLETDPQRPSRAVVFLSTDQVRSSAWEAVMQLRNNNGYWKIIVLTKYMLLELLTQMDAIHLLQDTE